jgi:WD40 repeat protein
LSESIIALSSQTGDVLIVNETGTIQTFNNVFGEGNGVTSLAVCSKGFFAGASSGQIAAFERAELDRDYSSESDQHAFKLKRTLATGNTTAIQCFAVSPDEANIFSVFESNQLVGYSLEVTEETGTIQLPVYASLEFHDGNVSAIDVAYSKPIFATAGTDRTVHIWNYAEKVCEFNKSFTEDILRYFTPSLTLTLLVSPYILWAFNW